MNEETFAKYAVVIEEAPRITVFDYIVTQIHHKIDIATKSYLQNQLKATEYFDSILRLKTDLSILTKFYYRNKGE